MYGAACDESTVADGITSLRKNAVVTIGGTVNTRYFARKGQIKQNIVGTGSNGSVAGTVADTVNDRPGYAKIADNKHGDLHISDAKLEAKIDVNDYFDAYLKLDFSDTNEARYNVSGIAQNYWIRWKNVCNTGFSMLVGRDTLKFGGVTPYGAIGSFTKNYDGFNDVIGVGGLGEIAGLDAKPTAPNPANPNYQVGEGMFAAGSLMPAHTTWDHSRVTQLTPSWATQDGSFAAELSLIQAIDTRNGIIDAREDTIARERTKYRSVNYGLGSGTLRLTWKPIEGLKLVASAMNLYAKQGHGRWNWRQGTAWSGDAYSQFDMATGQYSDTNTIETANNNTSVNFAFEYRPCFFNRLNLWASYTHGWNENWIKDMDSDVLSYGFGFDATEQLTFFA